MTRQVVATLTLTPDEVATLDDALRYYADTIVSGNEEADLLADIEQSIDRAERIRQRMRKSLERHGFRFTGELR